MTKSVFLVLAVIVSLLFMFDQPADAGCTCDPWCRGAGYRTGKCGDGHTCICWGGRRGRRDLEGAGATAEGNDLQWGHNAVELERTDVIKDADH